MKSDFFRSPIYLLVSWRWCGPGTPSQGATVTAVHKAGLPPPPPPGGSLRSGKAAQPGARRNQLNWHMRVVQSHAQPTFIGCYSLQPTVSTSPGKWGHQAVVEVCSSPPEPQQQQQLSSLRLWQNRENKLTL
ncbi:unnamed protein product [Sphagnum jensenii]|uniref:Uncharacterized protein n=1 Tax=Sphagnum jensenii TaxID=128206 RepID=A0ABP1B7E3_9BRYO